MDPNKSEILKGTTNFLIYSNQQIKGDKLANKSALVFKGLFNKSIPIALKRYQEAEFKVTGSKAEKDFQFLSSAENRHPNIIRFFGKAEKGEFSYLATELCECSVADIIDQERKEIAKQNRKTLYLDRILPNLPVKEIIRQSMEAVSFLHSINQIHRNLHPDNFLIFCIDPRTDHFIVKLTDFQHSKNVEKNPNDSGTLGKEGWVAPEILNNSAELEKLLKDQESGKIIEQIEFDKLKSTKKTDAFIMGCYCYYLLTGGYHPFGKGVAEQRNGISKGENNTKVYNIKWCNDNVQKVYGTEEAEWALSMIKDLIKYKPEDRKELKKVLKSRFFQPESYKIYGKHAVSPKPGLCIIVTQRKYYFPLDDTDDWESYCGHKNIKGISLDEERLQNTFVSFGYDILPFRNLRADEIRDNLSREKLIQKIGVRGFSDYASLVICYLGHGFQGTITGVDNEQISLNSITYDAFNDNLYPDFKGKPKTVIVLACQGNRTQKINQGSASSTSPTLANPSFSSSNNEEQHITPPVFDFIRLMSTIEEYQTGYVPGEGSPFIRSLCNALDYEYLGKNPKNTRDLTQLFTTLVTPVVGRSLQTPEYRSSLSKVIRFRKTEAPGTVFTLFDGAEGEEFKRIRSLYVTQRGYREKKLMYNRDYEALLRTVYGELLADPDGVTNEVKKNLGRAIAWIIYNRYYSKPPGVGAYKSLESVCKEPNQFNYYWNDEFAPVLDFFEDWLPSSIFDNNKDDTTNGATHYIKGEVEHFTCQIGEYRFFK